MLRFRWMAISVLALVVLVGCSSSPADLVERGCDKLLDNDIEGALADFDKAIELDAQYGAAYLWRGRTYQTKNEYTRAEKDYDESIHLSPDLADAYISRAWLRAAAPDASVRNGQKALEDIRRAAELENKSIEDYAGCAAAAHAEMGDFATAIKLQEADLRRISGWGDVEKAERTLEDYRARKPYRLKDGW